MAVRPEVLKIQTGRGGSESGGMFRKIGLPDPQRGMVDLHCHILPGLDDGARDMEETLSMLRIAAGEGITDIVATPHFYAGGRSAAPETVMRALETTRAAAEKEDIPIRLYPGNEIFYFSGLPEYIREGCVCTLNRSAYVLIEFPPSVLFRTVQNAMDAVMGEGFLPILAHAERYECLLKDFRRVENLREMGVRIQVNAGSVTGKSGHAAARFVHRLLKEEMADHVGTDAHRSDHRTPGLARCSQILIKKYGSVYADMLLRGNAGDIIGSRRE